MNWVSLSELRRRLPRWMWSAARRGFGWTYEGRRGDRVVTVHAASVIVGPAEDDCATAWQATEAGSTSTLSYWEIGEGGNP